MADLGSRALLPDGTPGYTFVTGSSQPESRERHRNYVFVDEHNRHRRLKVMRACAACRRRKIKCDAATTNTWPCGPCVKQQLECVPPSSDKEGQNDAPDDQRSTNFHSYHQSTSTPDSAHGVTTYPHQINVPASYTYATSSLPSSTSTFFDNSISGSSVTPQSISHDSLTPLTPQSYPQQTFHSPQYQPSPSGLSASELSHKSDTPDGELADVLRELKIDQGGVAPYIANQQTLGEVPAVEEQEHPLPAPLRSPNSTVQIPPEMMPSDQLAHKYFDYFFSNIHPYVPVINQAAFYRAWQTDPYAMPPLVLEGIFACCAHHHGHDEDRGRWLALAARHEESFRDMPRLSTIQGLILVMKARESAPKRGYYYRSWLTVQFMIQMGKDLGLQSHNKLHIQGKPCGCDARECVVKTRVWHTLFQMEVMIGGPQGRYDFSVDIESANLQVPQALPGIDFSEQKISQDQSYFVKLVHNVRVTAALYVRIKQADGDCATNEEFARHNDKYQQLGREFPAHLQIKFPEDGSPPSLPFHFVANLQAYHMLSFIMHLRPQLEMNEGRYDEQSWKDIMALCHNEATKICRLHEAILQNFGLNGLLCMVRGINTAIYTILSCTLLHLVAITSPDPTLNEKAKDYFTRHMRILERCSSSWPVPQLQVQIESLRQAFSADLNKPFELRQNFPFGSPNPSTDGRSPPGSAAILGQAHNNQDAGRRSYHGSFDTSSIRSSQKSLATSQGMLSSTGWNNVGTAYPSTQQMGWDPSIVVDRWHTAFNPMQLESPPPGVQAGNVPNPSLAPTSTPMYSSPQHQHAHASQQHPTSYFNAQQTIAAASQSTTPPTYSAPMVPQQQGFLAQGPATSPTGYASQGVQPSVTPTMWQEAVAQSSGWKRRHEGDTADNLIYKRMR